MGGSPIQHRSSIGAFAARMLSPNWQQRSSGRRAKSDGGNERSGFSLGFFLKVILLISVISNVEVPTDNNTWIYVGKQQQVVSILQRESISGDMTGETVRSKSSITEEREAEVGKSEQEKMMDPGKDSKVGIAIAITTLLTNAPELGSIQLKEGLLEMMLVMARRDEYIQQLVAREAIDADAALYKSNNDHIKERVLFGFSELGASGGSDAAIMPFADCSSTKLAEAFRRFLNQEKDSELRR